jgi:hypothetical protein
MIVQICRAANEAKANQQNKYIPQLTSNNLWDIEINSSLSGIRPSEDFQGSKFCELYK